MASKRSHIEEAERLLEAAKTVSKECGPSEIDRKTATLMVAELLDYSRCHAVIASAIGDDPRVGLDEY